MANEPVHDVVEGDGFAVANVDALGDRYGFRKIRRELGVQAMGMIAIAIPPGYETGRHYHEEQEETYFDPSRDGGDHLRRPELRTCSARAGSPRVDASTVRKLKNVGDGDALYFVVGGKDGYVGRDGKMPEGETSPRGSRQLPPS